MNSLKRYWYKWQSKRAARQLQPHPDKTFAAALTQFNTRLLAKEPFALVRFGDGEMMIINGDATDLSDKYHGEHRYSPGNSQDEQQRVRLTAALKYTADNYYVGIACPCCVGLERFKQLKSQSAQPEDQLTWANIFVNSNYPRFQAETVAALKTRQIAMVCHENASVAGLPFEVSRRFSVGANAWRDDHQRLLAELTEWLENERVADAVVVFAAGVLSNILIHELHQAFGQTTYIDAGSVFDVQMGLGETRKYLKRGKTLSKTCVWA